MTDELNFHLRHMSLAGDRRKEELKERIDNLLLLENELRQCLSTRFKVSLDYIHANRRYLPDYRLDEVLRAQNLYDVVVVKKGKSELDSGASLKNIFFKCARCVGYFQQNDLRCELCGTVHCPSCHKNRDDSDSTRECSNFRLYTSSYCGVGNGT